MKNVPILSVFVAFGVISGLSAQEPQVPASKKTELGLYVTARQAFEKWQADPDNVKIVDVRTPGEYAFVGHPAMAWNVPLMFLANEWDAARKRQVMKPNTEFLAQVKRIIKPTDTILVTCRSGQRSAPAANIIAQAGFKNVFSVIDGVEGDKVKDPDSVYNGQRMKNGWKNSGLPWTYTVDPKLMYLEKK